MRAGLVLALLLVLIVPLANGHAHHSDAWAREHFASAERIREALNGRPAAERTRHDYQRVLNAYRAVYLGAPASTKADPSVVAVAETMVEMGRRFDDDQILNKAINQYKFLRREYPGSKYRFDGLFTIGEIYKDDLNNSAAARLAFEEFLRRYPENRLADDAREAIAEIDQETKAPSVPGNQASNKVVIAKDEAKNAKSQGHSSDHGVAKDVTTEALARVTGIRHWSTPDYTRVAIDVEGDIKFSSRRIATPSRIFFDLRDTKLASTLVGKSFDVGDGFLKTVRVSQFAPGRTRVVLEVDNLSDYDAFMLPNPYRLIIDIHGRDIHGGDMRGANLPDKIAPGTAGKNNGAQVRNDPALRIENSSETGLASANNSSADDRGLITVETGLNAERSAVGRRDDAASPVAGMVNASRKTEPAALKKVIVEADDDDSTGSSRALKRTAHTGRVLALDKPEAAPNLTVREARPTSTGDRSLIRALGLKIGKIVIDPGHGGHDTGTIGPNGLEEKDLVLEVSRRLGKLLETRLGAEVVYTRNDDTFIPLETRTAIANQARADLFVSIHANSSHDPDARGVETYYLNFTSSPQALEVAARENAVSEKSIFELQDLVKKIALKEKIEESREFAGDVQQSLHSGLASKSPAIRDRGVKKAPFIVLIGANMPSILAEISFVSNPVDEHRLATSEYRERIAESLYRGIAKYVNGLSGVKIASKTEKDSAQ
jgi:N-acetylmuramoyl-L-alanine amidase